MHLRQPFSRSQTERRYWLVRWETGWEVQTRLLLSMRRRSWVKRRLTLLVERAYQTWRAIIRCWLSISIDEAGVELSTRNQGDEIRSQLLSGCRYCQMMRFALHMEEPLRLVRLHAIMRRYHQTESIKTSNLSPCVWLIQLV